ncbi:MAG: hypothetical protein HY913_13905 [Desulfomonile tiedjei]|nr:hypothetical protein [Desulfomonile tiedjei]
MDTSPDAKETIAKLMENLGTIGAFMLSEARAFLRKSWGASREEFMAAVDHIARNMKASGKMASEDIEAAAEQIKKSWELLDKEKDLDWDNFLNEIKTRLNTIGTITEETFNLVVSQAKDVLDRQWTAMGRLGEGQLKAFQGQSEQMAKIMRCQWGVFRDSMEKTGKRIDRALDAAWEAWKRKD